MNGCVIALLSRYYYSLIHSQYIEWEHSSDVGGGEWVYDV